jgi:hypothetical protein
LTAGLRKAPRSAYSCHSGGRANSSAGGRPNQRGVQRDRRAVARRRQGDGDAGNAMSARVAGKRREVHVRHGDTCASVL